MADPLYTFDRQSMRRISAAVQKSEGVKDRTGNKWYPVKGTAASLKIGKTKAAWGINTEATLEVWKRNASVPGGMEPVTKDDGTAVTFTAFNLFANIDPEKFVACLNGFLISGEC